MTDINNHSLVLNIPITIGVAIYFLYVILGWRSVKYVLAVCAVLSCLSISSDSAFVGLAIMLALSPVPGFIAKKLHANQANKMKKVCTSLYSFVSSVFTLGSPTRACKLSLKVRILLFFASHLSNECRTCFSDKRHSYD